jgi:hypothetical protein
MELQFHMCDISEFKFVLYLSDEVIFFVNWFFSIHDLFYRSHSQLLCTVYVNSP